MEGDCCWNILIAEYGDTGKSSCYLTDVIHVKPTIKKKLYATQLITDPNYFLFL